MNWTELILQGLFISVVTALSMLCIERFLVKEYRGRSKQDLIAEHKNILIVANILFFVGVFVAMGMYLFGGYSPYDLTPIFIGLGLAGLLPILSIIVISRLTRKSVNEVFVAFSMNQGVPMFYLLGALIIFATFFPLGLYRLLS